jgi:hypothetical protein
MRGDLTVKRCRWSVALVALGGLMTAGSCGGEALASVPDPPLPPPSPHQHLPEGPTHTIAVSMTGHSVYDDGSDICCSIVHRQAGGSGTHADPTTVAVAGSSSRMTLPPGTLLYAPTLRRYLLVEDSGTPASGGSTEVLDVWVGGDGFPESSARLCVQAISGRVNVVLNPPPGYPVTVGPLTGAHGCHI